MSDSIPRPADRAQYWRHALAAFATSGRTVRAFCHGLHQKRFYPWRRDLGVSPVARPTPAASDAVPIRG